MLIKKTLLLTNKGKHKMNKLLSHYQLHPLAE